MPSPEHKPVLPVVEEIDLLSLVLDEATDDKHEKRWKRISGENPHLARLIDSMPYGKKLNLRGEMVPLSAEMQKMIIDHVSLALIALEAAILREREVADETPAIADDGGVGDQQPSV